MGSVPVGVGEPVRETSARVPIRVLLSAFSCRAGHGSEPGSGWGWACALSAAGHDVTVLTRPVGRAENAAWLRAHPEVDLTLEYVEEGRLEVLARRLNRRGGAWAAYWVWHRRALARAQQLHAREPFDVVHHVTFATVVPGSPMWRLGVPFVFGPVASGQTAPRASGPAFGTSWREERLRTALVAMTRVNPLTRSAVRRSAVVMAANDDTADLVRAIGRPRIEPMCDTGIDPALIHRTVQRIRHQAEAAPGRRRVIWVGSLVPRKAPGLALDAFALAVQQVDAELHVVGDGPLAGRLRTDISVRRLGDRVVMHGRVPWETAQALLASADVMLFTSLRDGLGSQVVEGAAAGLPLVAVDLHGVASFVPLDMAVKVPFSTAEQTAAELAAGLVTVLSDDRRRAAMARAAIRFGARESWPRRACRMTQIYQEVMTS